MMDFVEKVSSLVWIQVAIEFCGGHKIKPPEASLKFSDFSISFSGTPDEVHSNPIQRNVSKRVTSGLVLKSAVPLPGPAQLAGLLKK